MKFTLVGMGFLIIAIGGGTISECARNRFGGSSPWGGRSRSTMSDGRSSGFNRGSSRNASYDRNAGAPRNMQRRGSYTTRAQEGGLAERRQQRQNDPAWRRKREEMRYERQNSPDWRRKQEEKISEGRSIAHNEEIERQRQQEIAAKKLDRESQRQQEIEAKKLERERLAHTAA